MELIAEIVFVVFVVAASLQVIHYLFFQFRLAFYKEESVVSSDLEVSVIIAARNERNNLESFLPQVLTQKGVKFEVIVVDDCSYDHTLDYLREMGQQYDHLRYTVVQENRRFEGGKKFALTMGIKSAKYENLIFIDADCYPASDYWLANMAESLKKRNIVLGYGAYEKDNTFLNWCIRFDTFQIAQNYLTYAMAGLPYMGVGRNLAYKSFLFFDNKGFATHQDLRSGDDDLFINEVAQKSNTSIQFNKEAYTYSIPEKTWSDWLNQKRRHVTTAKRYRFKHKILLIILPLSLYIFYGSFFVLSCLDYDLRLVLIIFGIRFLIQQLSFILGLRKTGALELFAVGVIFDLFYMIFYPLIVIVNVIEKCNEWKR